MKNNDLEYGNFDAVCFDETGEDEIHIPQKVSSPGEKYLLNSEKRDDDEKMGDDEKIETIKKHFGAKDWRLLDKKF